MNKKTNRNSIDSFQDEIFKKMPIRKKLALLDQFFKFAKTLQGLNNRKKLKQQLWK